MDTVVEEPADTEDILDIFPSLDSDSEEVVAGNDQLVDILELGSENLCNRDISLNQDPVSNSGKISKYYEGFKTN